MVWNGFQTQVFFSMWKSNCWKLKMSTPEAGVWVPGQSPESGRRQVVLMDGDRHHSRVLPGAGGYSTHHELLPPYLHISTYIYTDIYTYLHTYLHISTHIYTDTLPLHMYMITTHMSILSDFRCFFCLLNKEKRSSLMETSHCPLSTLAHCYWHKI